MRHTLFALLVLVLVLPGMARAQDEDGGTVTLNVGELLFVNISVGSDQTLTPTLTDFNNSYVDASQLTIDTKGNTAHNLYIRGDAGAWGYNPNGSGNADPSKPVGDLNFKLASAGTYTGLTTSNQVVDNLAAGQNAVNVDLRVDLDYDADVEGIYTLDYTVQVIAAP